MKTFDSFHIAVILSAVLLVYLLILAVKTWNDKKTEEFNENRKLFLTDEESIRLRERPGTIGTDETEKSCEYDVYPYDEEIKR